VSRHEPVIPVGTRVVLLASGWTGVVVKHVPPALEDRSVSRVAYVVRWDNNNHEGRVRSSKRLRVR
jgi:hypothetical protein